MKVLVARMLVTLLLAFALGKGGACAQAQPAGGGTLASLADIVAQGNESFRADPRPARVEAVVTFVSPSETRLYLQDGPDAVYADLLRAYPDVEAGNRVEVIGTVRVGWLVPRIVATSVRVLGESPMPEPAKLSLERLAAGEAAMKYVSVHGVVRDMMIVSSPRSLILLVSEEGEVFRIYCPWTEEGLPEHLLDSEIEAQGLCRLLSDTYAKAFGFILYQSSFSQTTVLQAGQAAPFDQATSTIRHAVAAPGGTPHRVKVVGVVTAHSGENLYVEDRTGVVRVKLLRMLPKTLDEGPYLEHEAQTQLQPGERVAVIGFRADRRETTPTLIDGEYRRLGEGTPIVPARVSIHDLVQGEYTGRLVTLRARLLDESSWTEAAIRHHRLLMESDGVVWQALWEDAHQTPWKIDADSYVQVTGVNQVNYWRMQNAQAFELVLRSPEDLQTVSAPPWWQWHSVRQIAGAMVGMAVLFLAWILFQRRELHRIQVSEERFRTLVEKSFDVVMVLNPDGSAKYVSPSGLTQLDCLIEHGFLGLIRGEDLPRVMDAFTHVLESPGRSIQFGIYRISPGNGPDRWLEAVGTNCLQVRSVEGVVVNIRDVTERRQAEEDLRRLNVGLEHRVAERTRELRTFNRRLCEEAFAREKVEEELRQSLAKEKELVHLKSNFVSMVSHEFRTPLGVIQSSSDILLRYLDRLSPEKRDVQLRTIRRAVGRMGELMEEVLQLARFEDDQVVCQRLMADVPRLCRRCIVDVTAANPGKCPITVTIDPPGFRADVDENLFVHILQNLLSNGVKYSPAGAPVDLQVRAAEGWLSVQVADRGCGIPAEDLPRMFTGFYRGSNAAAIPGSGLGLLIVKRCVELHGGSIGIESLEGVGTTVRLRVPVRDIELFDPETNADTELLFRAAMGQTEFLEQEQTQIMPKQELVPHPPSSTP